MFVWGVFFFVVAWHTHFLSLLRFLLFFIVVGRRELLDFFGWLVFFFLFVRLGARFF